jgi:parallel beta-helix repeat protein
MVGRRTVILGTLGALLCALVVSPSIAAGEQATYLVDSNADSGDLNPGDGVCEAAGGHCTLRAAIDEANTHTGDQTIEFVYKFTGTNRIPGCNLPAITADDLTIDGSEQWWVSKDRPGVEIKGSGCTLLSIQAERVTVSGVFFGGGSFTAVYVHNCGGGNLIGGIGSRERNVFHTATYGVHIGMGAGVGNAIIGNYFGTFDGHTPLSGFVGDTGILVESSYTTIWDNLIVGQSSAGIDISSSNSVVVWDNIVGADKYCSSAMPNGTGIYVRGTDAGTLIGPDNTVAGNTGHGIHLYHADNTYVAGNDIGGFGIGNGGDGIHIHLTRGAQIGDPDYPNTISDNSGNGIWADLYDVTVQGNSILDNGQDGVELGWSQSQIGGSGIGERNYISGNGGNGVHLNGTGGITVTGNYIGVGIGGSADYGNNGHGVLINNGGGGNVVGGTGVGEGNRIGYNHGDGVHLAGSSTQSNYVVGNVIGSAFNWAWDAPNHNHGVGIYNGAHDNWIGSTGVLSGGNVILASRWSGVAIVNSDDNNVMSNYIGTNGAGVDWGNAFYGVDVVNSSGNSIRENEIAYNGTAHGVDGAEAGVRVSGAAATDNMISRNSIHDNDGPGIELVSGANNSLAAPVITSAACGSVQGTACANCWIEFYSDSDDEGRVYEGHFTTPPSGAITWSGTVNGPWLTALAIGPESAKDTSPFSMPYYAGSCNSSPEASIAVTPTTGYTTTAFSFDASGCSDAEDPTSDLQVRWDWDGNGVYDTGWTTTKTAAHTYNAPGTYTVHLQVMDTLGLWDTATQQVSVSKRYWVHLPLVVRAGH